MVSLSRHRGADAVCTFALTGRPVWEARVGARHRGADLHHVAAQAPAGQVRTGLSASSSGGEWETAHALSVSLCTCLPIRSVIGPSQSSALRKRVLRQLPRSQLSYVEQENEKCKTACLMVLHDNVYIWHACVHMNVCTFYAYAYACMHAHTHTHTCLHT